MLPLGSCSWIYGTLVFSLVCTPLYKLYKLCSQDCLPLTIFLVYGRYKDGMSPTIKGRLSNSFLIGEIFGMLFFGVLIDRLGRRTGVVAATTFLVLGIALAAAAHGKSELG